MYRLAIADAFCPRPYDDRSLSDDALGGTECAIVLLAEALEKAAGLSVRVLQHCRVETYRSPGGVDYVGVANWRDVAACAREDAVVIINSPKLLMLWRRGVAASTRLILWRHNFLGNHYKTLGQTLQMCESPMVCVSRTHRDHCYRRVEAWPSPPPTDLLQWIANPVSVHHPGQVDVDPDKLIFCSSPHKGLEQTLALFSEVRRALPSLTLFICNPGYLANATVQQRGVVTLGALDRSTLHRHIAESLCVFYPQTVFPETFGLVAAEANTLGTPILAPDDFGALHEVVADKRQTLPEVSPDALIKRLEQWRAGSRPSVIAASETQPSVVAERWNRLLGGPGEQLCA